MSSKPIVVTKKTSSIIDQENGDFVQDIQLMTSTTRGLSNNQISLCLTVLSDESDGESQACEKPPGTPVKSSNQSNTVTFSKRAALTQTVTPIKISRQNEEYKVDKVKKTKKKLEMEHEKENSRKTRSSFAQSTDLQTKSNQYIANSKPRRRCTTNVVSYNEDNLTILVEKKTKSPKKYSKRIKNYQVEIEDDSNVSRQSDVCNENIMNEANQASPPKRQRADSPKTPTRSSRRTSPVKTPISLRSKNLFETPSTSLSKLTINTPTRQHKQLLAKKNLNTDVFSMNKVNDLSNTKAVYNDFRASDTDEESVINDSGNDNAQKLSRSDVADNYCNMSKESESGDDGDISFHPSNSSEDSSDSFEDYDSNSDDTDYNPKNNYKLKKEKAKTPKHYLRTPSKSMLKTPTIKSSMETPTKRFSRLSISKMTPTVSKRVSNIHKPSTPLQQARQKLHVSALPKSLPCREEQFNSIYTFLTARLSDNTGGCMYISGTPGTGKTATVNEVIRILRKKMNEGELAKFEYVDINALKLSEPRQIYVQIWKQLTGETRTWEDAQKMLQDRFSRSNSKRGITLLVVDELDFLNTKRQDVIYNLLDWPSKKEAKLVVVTIANTMDLPERILMGRVTSRLGLTRLTFPFYNFKQLEEIVISRLKNQNVFRNDTIQLVARKVAAVSGDARRALDICRRSTEVAEAHDRVMVTLDDVKQALDEMIASPKIQAIKHCSAMEKYFLKALCGEVTRTSFEGVSFYNVYNHMKTLVSIDGLQMPNISRTLGICARLGSYRLLITEHSRLDIHQRILLNVDQDDVYFATKEIEL